MAVERVAGSSWNQWPNAHGMGGRMPVESADNTLGKDDMDDIERHMKNIEFWKP
jgi:hypothetical protein